MITAPQLPGAMLAGLSRLSIPARLVLLATALLLILIGTNTYLNLELKRGADTLVAEARYVDALRRANAAEKSFGDLKYWLTDSAVSQLNLSEQRAQEARHALDDQLKNLAGDDPATVSAIRNEVEQLMSRAQQAINAYADDRRVIGNSLMAVARTHIVAVDQKLAQLVAKLREDAAQASEAAQSRAAQAVGVSWAIVVAASLLGLALTVLILRSIVPPLRRLAEAMRALTAGRTDIEIPPAGHDELGAMARTLSL